MPFDVFRLKQRVGATGELVGHDFHFYGHRGVSQLGDGGGLRPDLGWEVAGGILRPSHRPEGEEGENDE